MTSVMQYKGVGCKNETILHEPTASATAMDKNKGLEEERIASPFLSLA